MSVANTTSNVLGIITDGHRKRVINTAKNQSSTLIPALATAVRRKVEDGLGKDSEEGESGKRKGSAGPFEGTSAQANGSQPEDTSGPGVSGNGQDQELDAPAKKSRCSYP